MRKMLLVVVTCLLAAPVSHAQFADLPLFDPGAIELPPSPPLGWGETLTPPPPVYEDPPPRYFRPDALFDLDRYTLSKDDENIFDEALRGLGPSDTDKLIDYYQRRDADRKNARQSCLFITNNDLLRQDCFRSLR